MISLVNFVASSINNCTVPGTGIPFSESPLKSLVNLILGKQSIKDRLSPAIKERPILDSLTESLSPISLASLSLVSGTFNQIFKPPLRQLKIYRELLEKIPNDQIPKELREIPCNLENFEAFERYFQARDKLIVWQKVAEKAGADGAPNFNELETLDAFVQKAAQFGDWVDTNQGAQGITKLDVQFNYLTSIPAEIGKLTQLKVLRLSDNQISKIEGLDQLTQLKELWLDNNQISKIEGLDQLTQLKMLWLSDNQISKIEGLDQLTQLKELWLHTNQISKIEGLDQLTQLKMLLLSNNQISKIEGLDQLTQLKMLLLSDNQISKIERLDQLTQLKELLLSNNQISKIEGLDQLTQLEKLLLSDNQISKIEGLDQLTQLKELLLDKNQISKIEGLDQLTQLKELLLYKNQISKIEGLDQLTQLMVLWLYKNQISKIEGLDQLTQLMVLRLLDGNPIDESQINVFRSQNPGILLEKSN